MTHPTIAVLLSTHARLQNLPTQIEAIRAQTVKPAEIRIWHDGPGPPPVTDLDVVASTANLGVWPRFLHCLEFASEFVCVFDDDTIPGPRWLENCLATHEQCGGLVGAAGVRFPKGGRKPRPKFGWPQPDHRILEMDVIGHSWFFRREWLWAFAKEPRYPGITTAGEDYHLSVSLQKHLGLGSFTAPHPKNKPGLWGSTQGRDLGSDEAALWTRPGEEAKKRIIHQFYRDGGWTLLHERQNP
jgi:hypothetical protein